MRKKYFLVFILFLMVFLPLVSIAQTSNDPTGCSALLPATGKKIQNVFVYVSCILQRSVIPLVFGLAMLVFLWGVFNFVVNGENEDKRSKGKQYMIWGIIGLTVMVALWGLVSLVIDTFGLEGGVIPQLPPLQGS